MALLFCDGFDHYGTGTGSSSGDLYTKWGLNLSSAQYNNFGYTAGRLGSGQAITTSQYTQAKHPLSASYGTAFAGIALYTGYPEGGPYSLLQFTDGTNVQTTLSWGAANGNLQVWRGGKNSTLLGTTTTNPIKVNQWNYIEISIVFATGATGSVTVKVNNVVVLTLTTVQTCTTANANFNAVILDDNSGGVGTSSRFDDFYLCDNSTANNNTFLGDVTIPAIYPSGAGRANTLGAPVGAATAWQALVSCDSDTSYVPDATAGDLASFTLTSLGSIPSLFAVQCNLQAKKDVYGARVTSVGVGNGTTENFDAGSALNTSYNIYTRQLNINPLTTAAWAVGDLTTLQGAVKTIS